MKATTKKILGVIVCAVIIGILWAAYAWVFIVFIPELPLKARIAIAVACVIPTVVLLGTIADKLKGARNRG